MVNCRFYRCCQVTNKSVLITEVSKEMFPTLPLSEQFAKSFNGIYGDTVLEFCHPQTRMISSTLLQLIALVWADKQ